VLVARAQKLIERERFHGGYLALPLPNHIRGQCRCALVGQRPGTLQELAETPSRLYAEHLDRLSPSSHR